MSYHAYLCIAYGFLALKSALLVIYYLKAVRTCAA